MFPTEFETFADYQDADELAFQECIEIINSNVEEVIINKADAREKKWWNDENYKIIDEERIQFLNAFSNVSRQNRVSNTGSTRRRSWESSKQSDASFTPKQLPKLAANSCDTWGNPWPTVIVEIANIQNVIVLKLWKWGSRTNQNGTPLRRLTCYKFCRKKSPRDGRENYLPVQTLEFGTIDRRGQQYNGCAAAGMCTLNISPNCIFIGCPRPYPIANNVVIDLFDIQQEIFDNM
ncbi:hypothetical protein GLOIN_2v1697953 [Rhizophagus clarus]|uniref:Uncharacterized protein n=1 Tax=Rhizophagus clarus TaxID=94130 RepID=A0A8H3L7L8_9GLOM|nr:hypothetical protein GLOIN_2v1697953 [Rhizophagus clarus]